MDNKYISIINGILEDNHILLTFDLEVYSTITGKKVKTYKDKKNGERFFYVNYNDVIHRMYYTKGIYLK